MKTQEQQKIELCDEFYKNVMNARGKGEIVKLTSAWSYEYFKITKQKPLSQDPYADEVFSGRLLRVIKMYWRFDKMSRLSQLPNVDFFCHEFGFGKKMREEYIEVMTTYEMFDKI